MDLLWGARVASRERWMGRLHGIVLEEDSLTPTHLVVGRGLLFTQEVAVDMGSVDGVEEGSLYLTLSTEEFLGLKPSNAREDASVTLNSRTQVLGQGGGAFVLKGIRTGPGSRAISHLVIAPTGWGKKQVLAPVGDVQAFSREGVALKAAATRIGSYTVKLADQEIERAVWEAFNDPDSPVEADIEGITITARSGVVELEGNVRQRHVKDTASNTAASVEGVSEVRSSLVSDEELEANTALALSGNPEVRGRRLTVHSSMGRITLQGIAFSNQARDAAESVTRSVPGVLRVKNDIIVESPPEKDAPSARQDVDLADGKPPQKGGPEFPA